MTSTFVKVHDNLLDHPAWMDLDPVHVGVWTLVLGYCRRNKTDGHFPARAAIKAGAQADEVDDLVAAGRFHAPGHDCADCPQPAEGQLYLHAYLEHQSSRADQEALSAKRAEAGRRGGKARQAQAADLQVQATHKQVAEQTAGNTQADASKRQPEVEVEGEKNTPARTRAAAYAAEFETWWQDYPRKTAKPEAAKAYARARKNTSAEDIAAGLANAMQVWRATGTEPRFIPHPATWLNQGRWADEVPMLGMPAAPTARQATLRQCPTDDPHPRHQWEDGRNLHHCQGVTA